MRRLVTRLAWPATAAFPPEADKSGGPARSVQFVEYRQDANDLCPRAEDCPRSMKSSIASVEAWNGHGPPELARAHREKVERINRDLNERRSPAVRPGSQPAERYRQRRSSPEHARNSISASWG